MKAEKSVTISPHIYFAGEEATFVSDNILFISVALMDFLHLSYNYLLSLKEKVERLYSMFNCEIISSHLHFADE